MKFCVKRRNHPFLFDFFELPNYNSYVNNSFHACIAFYWLCSQSTLGGITMSSNNSKGTGFLVKFLLVFLLIEAVFLYCFTPALNIFTFKFWFFIIFPVCFALYVCFEKTPLKTIVITLCALLTLIFVVFGLIHTIGASDSNETHSQIAKFNNDGKFTETVSELTSPADIPIVDKESAFEIGNKLIVSNEKYSQSYTLSSDVNLISYNNDNYMIMPLVHSIPFNFKGIPGYVLVNIHTSEAKLIELEGEKCINYAPSSPLNKDLFRHLRFNYPFTIFGDEQFEIDDNGQPYFIVPIFETKSAISGGRYIKEVLIVDAVSGEIKKYSLDNVPDWVDNVYSVERLMKEISWHLSYDRYATAFLSANNPPITRYEYSNEYYEFIDNGDVCVYTGVKITYATDNHRNNVAFIVGNLKTGEVTYCSDYGIAESDAQTAAINLFPEDQYVPSRVLLVNIEGNPAYYLMLKNHLNHAEKYAFVNKTNPVFFVAGDSVDEALRNYYQTIGKRYPYSIEYDQNQTGIHDNTKPDIKEKTITGTVSNVSSGTIDGNTVFLFSLKGKDEFFTSYLSINIEQLLKLVPDANVTITYEVINEENIVNTIVFE